MWIKIRKQKRVHIVQLQNPADQSEYSRQELWTSFRKGGTICAQFQSTICPKPPHYYFRDSTEPPFPIEEFVLLSRQDTTMQTPCQTPEMQSRRSGFRNWELICARFCLRVLIFTTAYRRTVFYDFLSLVCISYRVWSPHFSPNLRFIPSLRHAPEHPDWTIWSQLCIP